MENRAPEFAQTMNLDRVEEIDKLYEQLQAAVKFGNRMTFSEFEYFKPLFNKEELAALSASQVDELCKDWRSRVSLYDPVEIIHDETGEVLITLPPMFSKISSFNDLGIDTDVIINEFSNAMGESKNPMSLKPEKMTQVMSLCLQKAASKTSKKSYEEYAKCMDKLRGETQPIESGKVKDDDYEWEDDV